MDSLAATSDTDFPSDTRGEGLHAEPRDASPGLSVIATKTSASELGGDIVRRSSAPESEEEEGQEGEGGGRQSVTDVNQWTDHVKAKVRRFVVLLVMAYVEEDVLGTVNKYGYVVIMSRNPWNDMFPESQ